MASGDGRQNGGAAATVEFSVNLTCQSCVRKTEAALSGREGVSAFSVDLARQSVVVETTLPTAEVQRAIEAAGKTAVVVGAGGAGGGRRREHLGAAVAALGGALGAGDAGVKGVVRFVQVPDWPRRTRRGRRRTRIRHTGEQRSFMSPHGGLMDKNCLRYDVQKI